MTARDKSSQRQMPRDMRLACAGPVDWCRSPPRAQEPVSMSSPEPTEQDPLLSLAQGRERRHLGVISGVFIMLNRMIGTGIFSIPSSIYQLIGSVGWSIVFWILGGIMGFCGFSVYLEYGLEMPHSGGEKNYLERVFTRPPRLALTVFSVCAIILSFSTSNSYAFGNYVQLGLGYVPDEVVTRWIASITVGVICFIHARFPSAGRAAFNTLGSIKVVILVFIAACGPLLALGVVDVGQQETMRENFGDNLWKSDGFGGGLYNLSVALLRVSYSYRGWETLNLVMGEVKNPQRTVVQAGIIALTGITTLYTLCTFAYFSVVPKSEVADSGVVIAGVFLLKLFGESASARLLPLVICLSNLGNILVVAYAASRVAQEVGKHNILPCSNLLGSNKPWGTPIVGLALHFFMTVLTLFVPPPGDVYNFVIDVSTYPVTIFATLVTIGLIYVHRNPESTRWHLDKGYRAPLGLILIFLISNLFMIVFPWMPPPTPKTGLPYYASPLAALSVMGAGALYWYLRKDHILQQVPPNEETEWVQNYENF